MPRRSSPPKPTLVLFVRHGQTPTTGATLPGRAPGLHLADKGVAQAEAAATRIAGLRDVAAVYASPMERTRETAAPLARACKLRVRQA
jgi:broad specificity phosphatase PhoE